VYTKPQTRTQSLTCTDIVCRGCQQATLPCSELVSLGTCQLASSLQKLPWIACHVPCGALAVSQLVRIVLDACRSWLKDLGGLAWLTAQLQLGEPVPIASARSRIASEAAAEAVPAANWNTSAPLSNKSTLSRLLRNHVLCTGPVMTTARPCGSSNISNCTFQTASYEPLDILTLVLQRFVQHSISPCLDTLMKNVVAFCYAHVVPFFPFRWLPAANVVSRCRTIW
jgi:hypothetical protein